MRRETGSSTKSFTPRGGQGSSLTPSPDHAQTWESELAQARDPDSEFILEGIREGFRLTMEGSRFTPAEY